jgi:acetyl esterase/lipase
VGYFSRIRRFWTNEDFPEANKIREQLTGYIRSHIETSGRDEADYRSALRQIAPSAGDPVQLVEEVTYLAADRQEKLDLFLPARQPKDPPSPAVIWVHGNQGDKADPREREFCETIANAGYVCASINYGPWTQSPRAFRNNICDGKNAVRFLRVHAAEYHIDPSRIALFGGSAGANVALMAGLTAGDKDFEPLEPYPGVSSAVSVIGDFYGAADNLTFEQVVKHRAEIPPALLAEMRACSPVNHITSASPPIFIAQGKDDPLMDYHQSVELDEVLTTKAVPHEFILMDNVGHGFDLSTWKNRPLPRDLRPLVLDFLAKHLGPPPQGGESR